MVMPALLVSLPTRSNQKYPRDINHVKAKQTRAEGKLFSIMLFEAVEMGKGYRPYFGFIKETIYPRLERHIPKL